MEHYDLDVLHYPLEAITTGLDAIAFDPSIVRLMDSYYLEQSQVH